MVLSHSTETSPAHHRSATPATPARHKDQNHSPAHRSASPAHRSASPLAHRSASPLAHRHTISTHSHSAHSSPIHRSSTPVRAKEGSPAQYSGSPAQYSAATVPGRSSTGMGSAREKEKDKDWSLKSWLMCCFPSRFPFGNDGERIVSTYFLYFI